MLPIHWHFLLVHALLVISVPDGGLLINVAGLLVNLAVDWFFIPERRFDRLLVVLRHFSHLVVWPAAVVD